MGWSTPVGATPATASPFEARLHTETIAAAAAPFADITGISQDYRELYGRIQCISNVSGANDWVLVEVNGVTSLTDYKSVYNYGYSATSPADGAALTYAGNVRTGTTYSNTFGMAAGASTGAVIQDQLIEFWIRDYSQARNQVITWSSTCFLTTTARIYSWWGVNTYSPGTPAAITSLTGLDPNNGTGWAVGSTIELWGRGSS